MIGVRQIIRITGSVAVAAGLITLLYVGFVVADATAYWPAYGGTPATATASASSGRTRRLVASESLGQIHIERLGLRARIREGESAAVLRHGVGHLSDTAWLGDGGNVVLAGHRDTVFRALRKIRPGDVIEIVTVERSVRYSVDQTAVVSPSNLVVLQPSGDSMLTLITCYPFTFFGSAPDRFVVRAREITPKR